MAHSPVASLKRALWILLPLAVVAGLWFGVVRPMLTSDEDRLRTVVLQAVAAADQRQVGDLLKDIPEDYSDRFHRDRRALQQSLNYVFLAFKSWRTEIVEPPSVTVAEDGQRGVAVLRVRCAFASNAGDAPTGGDLVAQARGTDRFRLHFAKRDGRWWILSCDEGANSPALP